MRFQKKLQQNIERCREQFMPPESALTEILSRVSAPVQAPAANRPARIRRFNRYITAVGCLCVAVALVAISVFALMPRGKSEQNVVSANSLSRSVSEARMLEAVQALGSLAASPEGTSFRFAESVWNEQTVSVGMSGMLGRGELMRVDYVLSDSYLHGDEYVYDQPGTEYASVTGYRVKSLEDSLYEYEYVSFERSGIKVYAQYKRMKNAGEEQGKAIFLNWVDRVTV